jgi:DNA-binding beta-propeller fold protein YncE
MSTLSSVRRNALLASLWIAAGVITALAERTFADPPLPRAESRGPSSVVWTDDTTVEVLDGESGTVSRWNIGAASDAKPVLQVRKTPAPRVIRDTWSARSPDGTRVATGSPWSDRVITTRGTSTVEIEGVRTPVAGCWSRDGRSLWIATDDPLDEGRRVLRWTMPDASTERDRELPRPETVFRAAGATNVAGIVAFPRPGPERGELLAFTHLVPKSRLPSTQIEQGWVFTNAVTIVDFLAGADSHAGQPRGRLVPLDTRTRGFANPSGVTASPDGKWLYVAHSGTETVSVVDVVRVLAEVAPEPLSAESRGSDATTRTTGLYDAPDLARTRRFVPRRWTVSHQCGAIAISPDGKRAAVAHPFVDRVSIVETATGRVASLIELMPGNGIEASRQSTERVGAALFHSGGPSFGGQFSCASCHPRGHTDGLSWDLPADGFNNFQNTKSLLDAAGTGPYGWHGSSATLRDRMAGTLRGLFQHTPTEDETAALEAYLESLSAPPREPAARSARWTRGREVFDEAGCANCHAGRRFTDGKRHDLGLEHAAPDTGPAEFDTPSLLGAGGSGPWLHDGRARTLESIFREHDPAGRHGEAKELDGEDFRALIEYVSAL